MYRRGRLTAVDALDLTIDPGERVALVGPSGAGKSTIIGLANATVVPTQGSVEIFGTDSSVVGHRRHQGVPADNRIGGRDVHRGSITLRSVLFHRWLRSGKIRSQRSRSTGLVQ